MAGVDGIVSGINTGQIISQLMASAQRPTRKLQAQFDQLSAKRTAMQEFNTLLSKLQTAVKAMDTSEELGRNTVASTQPDALAATVSGGLVQPGSYAVRVTSLATGSVHTSAAMSSANAPLSEGTLSLTVLGATTAVPMDAASGTDTIEGLASYINANVAGASAYVLDTGSGANPFRLVIQSDETGAVNGVGVAISYTGSGNDLDPTQQQAAADSSLQVAGLTVNTASNNATGVLPGVTLDLKQATSGDATINVTRDATGTADNIATVVSAYNDVMTFLGQQLGSATEPGGPLSGDSTLRTVSRRLHGILSGVGGQGTLAGIGSLGLGSDQSGQLQFDIAKFTTAMGGAPSDAMAMLTGSGGLFGELATELDLLADPVVGLIQPRLTSFETRMEQLADAVADQEARLVTYETSLREQFTAMELVMSRYQATQDFLTQQIEAMNAQNR